MEYKKFFWINLCGSSIYVGLYLSLGIFFHNTMENLIKQVDIVRHSVFGGFILVMAVIVSIYISKWLSK